MDIKQRGLYYSGTSGLLLPVPNKEFYPEEFKSKSRLCYYGSLFNSIEINSSFYKVPMAATVGRWAAEVPENFKFTFKLWRGITHNRNLGFDPADVSGFINRISFTGEKKGCLLVQFPGSIRWGDRLQVEYLLQTIRNADPGAIWKTAVEFRHQSWYRQETSELIDRLGMSLVLHDKLLAGKVIQKDSSNFVYVRFHGPDGDYKGSYTDDFLHEYASYIKEWLEEGKEVYVYFNNTIGNAIGNLRALERFIQVYSR